MSEAEFEEFNILHSEIESLMDADSQSKLHRPSTAWYTIADAQRIYRRMLKLAKYEVPHA